MTRRTKRGGRSPRSGGRLERAAQVILVLVVLAFGFSIAVRYAPGDGAEPEMLPMEHAEPEPDLEALKNRPTVDIRNGCGQAGLAEHMMHRLRRAGFDVVEYRNADRYDYQKTLVRDRSGRTEAARLLETWLQREFGVGEREEDRVAVPEADLLLILGVDLADTLARRQDRR